MSITPHIFFSGNCAEAFGFYQQVLGGELRVMTHADLPPDADRMPGAEPHHVMHANLTAGDAQLFGADDPTGDDGAKVGVSIVYTAPDAATARKVFDALADGGEVQVPFASTFWSAGFGACLDRFGVPWMVDTTEPA